MQAEEKIVQVEEKILQVEHGSFFLEVLLIEYCYYLYMNEAWELV